MLFEFDEFVLDESAYELRRSGAQVKVDPKVLDVLAYMLRRPGQLITKDELVEHVWEGRVLSETVLTGAVSKLRKVLGPEYGEKLIVNVYGRGYRFSGAVRSTTSPPSREDAANGVAAPAPEARSPFVGRGAALARIETALREASGGRGRIVAVAGEPGIGKTELAEVAAGRAAAAGLTTAWGHCRAGDGGPPFWPIVQVLRSALEASSSIKARDAVGLALASLLPDSSPKSGWAAETASYRVFDIVARAMQALTADHPMLLILDDLHWADAASLRLLSYLAPEISHLALLVMVTLRNTETPPTDPRLAATLGHRNCEYFELERLTEADVAEYTKGRLGAVEPDLSRAVYARSEGNPFFMVELLRPFQASSLPRAGDLALSGPALDILRQKLRALSAEATTTLQAAAVIGRDFDLGLLGAVTKHDAATLLDHLEPAKKNSTVVSLADRPGVFSFGHDLIRSALLDDLPATERARLHLAVAESMELRHPTSGDPAPELVHHLLSAVPLGDVDKAVEYARRSALAATYVNANADAAALLRRALSALDLAEGPRPRQRCELLLGLSHCERVTGDSRFLERLSEVVALGREHGFGDVLAEAGRLMSNAPGFIALAGAREVLEAADRALPPENAALRADVLAHLAWTAPYCFDKALANDLVSRAEALGVESSNPASLAIALSAKLYFASGPGNEDAARAISDRIDRIEADRAPVFRAYWSAQMEFSRVVLSLQHADMAAAERSLAAFGAAAREIKHAELEWHHERASMVLRMNRGDFAGSVTALKQLEDRAKELELFAAERICSADWVVLLRETAGVERIAPFESLLVPEEADCPCRLARKMRLLAEIGATARARGALELRSSDSLRRLPEDRDYLAAVVNLSVAAVLATSQSHAEVLYELLLPHRELYAADIRLHSDGSVAHYLGMLARFLGKEREAVLHFEEGLERNAGAGFPALAAHSAYEFARTLVESSPSDRGKARELFDRAVGTARSLGMEPLRKDAERALLAL